MKTLNTIFCSLFAVVLLTVASPVNANGYDYNVTCCQSNMCQPCEMQCYQPCPMPCQTQCCQPCEMPCCQPCPMPFQPCGPAYSTPCCQPCPTPCCQPCPTPCCQPCQTQCCQPCPTPCCQPCFQVPCCQPKAQCCSSGCSWALGAVALGAGAGAAAGYAAGHDNHHHKKCKSKCDCDKKCECTNVNCPCPCGRDTCESLEFDFCLTADIALTLYQFPYSLISNAPQFKVTSFVVTPSSQVITGKTSEALKTFLVEGVDLFPALLYTAPDVEGFDAQEIIDFLQSCLFEDTITINDPCYGIYHMGLQIEFDAKTCPLINLPIMSNTVRSSRSCTYTILPEPIELALDIRTGGVCFSQTAVEFVYGCDIPSKPTAFPVNIQIPENGPPAGLQ